ncbi:MAG: ABC transporter permease [Janthinobacterium lividum]
MFRFVIRRAGALVAVLLVLSVIVFVLQQISPGDPARAALGANASREAVDAQRQRLGLDDPLPVQFFHFLANASHGDFGTSYRTHRAVSTDLASAFPATLELVLVAFVIAVFLAALFAASAALSWPLTGFFRGLLLLGATAPPFLLALGAIVAFYARLGWLPASGRGAGGVGSELTHLVLPATVLAIAPALAIGRILRAGLETTLVADHIRTARSKGLGEASVLARHVLRNAIGPALAMGGLQLGFMFAGDVVVEQVFSWPGMGNYLASSIPTSDYPAIAAVTLVLGAVYVVVNTVTDVLQTAADPRLA